MVIHRTGDSTMNHQTIKVLINLVLNIEKNYSQKTRAGNVQEKGIKTVRSSKVYKFCLQLLLPPYKCSN